MMTTERADFRIVDSSLSSTTPPKIREAIKLMIMSSDIKVYFYGEFSLNIIRYIQKNHEQGFHTLGVNTSRSGFQYFYNEEFLEVLSQEELNFIHIHELMHLIFDHPSRTTSGSYNPSLANIVQDWLINHLIYTEIMKCGNDTVSKYFAIPTYKNGKNIGKHSALFLPKEYLLENPDGKLVFEDVYEWVVRKKKERDEKKKEQEGQCPNPTSNGDGDDEDNDEGNEPNYSSENSQAGVETFDMDWILDEMENNDGMFMDVHLPDEVNKMEKDIIRDMAIQNVKAAISRGNRGNQSGELESHLGSLIKKRKDHLKFIKNGISSHIFGTKKLKSIHRPNRKQIDGLKGKKKYKNVINVILDVSGSMSGLHEKVLSYVFQNDISIQLIQADTEIKKIDKINSMKQLQDLKLIGFGGTVLQPAIDFVANELNFNSTLILTDSATDTLDLSNLAQNVMIISTAEYEPPISKKNKKYRFYHAVDID